MPGTPPSVGSSWWRFLPAGVLCSMLLATSVLAQDQGRLQFRHLTVEDGLSSSWVRAVAKDAAGFVWFGTADGLDRFDGSRLVSYRQQPGRPGALASSFIGALLLDRRGTLWVGLGRETGAAVAAYDPHSDTFRHFAIDRDPVFAHEFEVNQLREDREGRIWISTTAGLYVLDAAQRSAKLAWRPACRPLVPGSCGVWRSAVDRSGRTWLATAAGLHWFDPAAGTAVAWAPVIDGRELALGLVWDILVDVRGELWAAVPELGLLRVDPLTLAAKLYRSGAAGGLVGRRPRRLAEDGRGRLYVGTEDAGLNVLEIHTGNFSLYRPDPENAASLSADSVYAIHPDDQDGVWIGTFNGGVDYASPFQSRFGRMQARSGGLSNPHVTAVVEDRKGRLWIGTDGGGLNRVDRASGRFTSYREAEGLYSDAVISLLEDAAGRIWIGTWAGGLQVLDPETGRLQGYRPIAGDPGSLPDTNALTILELSRDQLIVGTLRAGPQVLDRRTGRFAPLASLFPGAGAAYANAIVLDREGNLWLGRDDALRIERGSGRVTSFRLNGGQVFAILEDRRGNVWFGTETGGLKCLPAGSTRIRGFTTADGLPSNNVRGLVEDEAGSLWLSTARGLVRFADAASVPERPRLLVFDARDGLQGDEFNKSALFRSVRGELFFGGQHGLTTLLPRNLRLNERPPRVAVTRTLVSTDAAEGGVLAVLARLPDPTGTVVLSPGERMVTFEFAALDFALPEKNRYSYRLEGFDRDWSPPSAEKAATYTNLPAGSFRFRVRAANNDGFWNEAGASVAVRRTPRVHETAWFAPSAVAALALSAFAAHRLRMRRHLRRELLLEARFARAVARIRTLSGMLPICAWCRRVRSDEGYWTQVEVFVREHSEAEFASAMCPECACAPPGAPAREGRAPTP